VACSTRFESAWGAPAALGAVLALILVGASGSESSTAPIWVTDDAGTAVTLQRPAARIVSLAPSITEQLFAIGAGDRIIGTSAYSDYPPAARSIPVVAAAGAVDLERVTALRPDLIVFWGSGYPPATREALKRLGPPVYVSEATSFESIATSLERLGRLTGAVDAAGIARQFRATVQQLRERYSARRPVRAFYQIWRQPLMTLSGRHITSEALALCGAHNIFEDLAPLVPTVSAEAVIAADPQIILTGEPGGVDHGALDLWKRYPFVSAVAKGQLVTLDSDRIDRPTPRMLQELARLCDRVQAAREASGP
jgi:iron complex transport system substrate-binding protein